MDGNGKSRSRDLLDAASCRVSVAKIRELRRVKATDLCLNLLLSDDAYTRYCAVLGLRAVCRKALRSFLGRGSKGLFVPPSYRRDEDRWAWANPEYAPDNTRDYINYEIAKLQHAHEGLSRRRILNAAMENKFRYFPRRVCCHLVDMLRKYARCSPSVEMDDAADFE